MTRPEIGKKHVPFCHHRSGSGGRAGRTPPSWAASPPQAPRRRRRPAALLHRRPWQRRGGERSSSAAWTPRRRPRTRPLGTCGWAAPSGRSPAVPAWEAPPRRSSPASPPAPCPHLPAPFSPTRPRHPWAEGQQPPGVPCAQLSSAVEGERLGEQQKGTRRLGEGRRWVTPQRQRAHRGAAASVAVPSEKWVPFVVVVVVAGSCSWWDRSKVVKRLHFWALLDCSFLIKQSGSSFLLCLLVPDTPEKTGGFALVRVPLRACWLLGCVLAGLGWYWGRGSRAWWKPWKMTSGSVGGTYTTVMVVGGWFSACAILRWTARVFACRGPKAQLFFLFFRGGWPLARWPSCAVEKCRWILSCILPAKMTSTLTPPLNFSATPSSLAASSVRAVWESFCF